MQSPTLNRVLSVLFLSASRLQRLPECRLKLLLSFPTALEEERERKKQKELSVSEHCLQLGLRVFSSESPRSQTSDSETFTNPELWYCMLIHASCLVFVRMYMLANIHDGSFSCTFKMNHFDMYSAWFIWAVCVYICLHCFIGCSLDLASLSDMLLRVRVDDSCASEQFVCNQTAINVIASTLKIIRSQRLYLE